MKSTDLELPELILGTLFGAMQLLVFPSFWVPPSSLVPAVEAAWGTPGPGAASKELVPVPAPGAACPTTAGVPSCVL